MAINSRHVLYAAKRSLWFIPVFAVVLGLMVVMRGGTAVDFAYGMAPLLVFGFGYFTYWLWRTQRRL
jgi:hypothetical protein